MAKHKGIQVESDKTRLELRFDSDVAEAATKLAGKAGISLNQLMQGMARWAVEHANVGELEHMKREGRDVFDSKPIPGCLWFADDTGVPVFELDFTERRVVREVKGVRK